MLSYCVSQEGGETGDRPRQRRRIVQPLVLDLTESQPEDSEVQIVHVRLGGDDTGMSGVGCGQQRNSLGPGTSTGCSSTMPIRPQGQPCPAPVPHAPVGVPDVIAAGPSPAAPIATAIDGGVPAGDAGGHVAATMITSPRGEGAGAATAGHSPAVPAAATALVGAGAQAIVATVAMAGHSPAVPAAATALVGAGGAQAAVAAPQGPVLPPSFDTGDPFRLPPDAGNRLGDLRLYGDIFERQPFSQMRFHLILVDNIPFRFPVGLEPNLSQRDLMKGLVYGILGDRVHAHGPSTDLVARCIKCISDPGTGKSHAILAVAEWLCYCRPGSRVVISSQANSQCLQFANLGLKRHSDVDYQLVKGRGSTCQNEQLTQVRILFICHVVS